jgi:hypothetical protein
MASDEARDQQAAQQPTDEELLRRAELALTQLNNAYGLEPDQSATLTAIRLRLEGKPRVSLEELLTTGKDLRGSRDPLTEAMTRPPRRPTFEDALKKADNPPKKKKPSLDDLL